MGSSVEVILGRANRSTCPVGMMRWEIAYRREDTRLDPMGVSAHILSFFFPSEKMTPRHLFSAGWMGLFPSSSPRLSSDPARASEEEKRRARTHLPRGPATTG